MAELVTKVKEYCKANGVDTIDFINGEVVLQNNSDGKGTFIKEWNLDIPKPTESQLSALETKADAEENLCNILENRKSEYPSIADLVVALYDDEDKAAIDAKRAAVKAKYPKPS